MLQWSAVLEEIADKTEVGDIDDAKGCALGHR
jgi:hypothetical protein